MAREKNLLQTAELTVSTNPIIIKQLETLVRTGKFGKTAAEAAERLIAQKIGELEDAGKIPPPKD